MEQPGERSGHYAGFCSGRHAVPVQRRGEGLPRRGKVRSFHQQQEYVRPLLTKLPNVEGINMTTSFELKRFTSVKDAVTIVTGAGGGIGRATALTVAAEGSRVGITDVNVALVAETADMIKAAGGDVIATPADVVNPHTIYILTTK